MLELIIGIVLGTAFHEFWQDLFDKAKAKINQWSSSEHKADGEVVEGEVVQEAQASDGQKEAPAS
ncbi:MAG: hypothetical protein V2I33_03005 [Kangiellaceae bacterium]|jgi:hypothetical protein|nr:hypothetical protein [Kangiellaceae bacterium]